MKLVRHLGREDWIDAGMKALATNGHPSLKVEAVARQLSVSKGSFYWHFRDRDAWCLAVLAYWEHLAFARMVRPCATDLPGRRSVARVDIWLDLWPELERAVMAWASRDVAAARAWSSVQMEQKRVVKAAGVHRIAA